MSEKEREEREGEGEERKCVYVCVMKELTN